MPQKFPTKHEGVRYWEHPTRKHGNHPDRYFTIRFRTPEGKLKEEGLGWASKGMNAKRASQERGEIILARTKGEGPTSLEAKREARKQADARAKDLGRTLAEVAEGYLERQTQRGRVVVKDDANRLALHVLPVLGSKPIRAITPDDVRDVQDAVKALGRADATVLQVLALIRAVFNFAIEEGFYVGNNPTKHKKIEFPKPHNQRMRVLSSEEIEAILSALQPASRALHDISLVAAFTGMRWSEIVNIEWQDVDFNNEEIFIPKTKNKEPRTAYMTPRIKEMLLSRRNTSDSNWVFTDRHGDKINKLSNTFFRVIGELGLNVHQNQKGKDEPIKDPRKKVVFHTLRHTFCSNLGEQGENAFMLMALSGHKSFSMAQRYVKLGADAKKAAVNRVEQRLSGTVIPFRSANDADA